MTSGNELLPTIILFSNLVHSSHQYLLLLSEIPANAILELFGKMFFEFCQDSGYDKILQVLGATPRDFLQVSGNMVLQRLHIIFISMSTFVANLQHCRALVSKIVHIYRLKSKALFFPSSHVNDTIPHTETQTTGRTAHHCGIH
jgi:hypothetical protein